MLVVALEFALRFSLDTESGFKDVVFVTSAYGLGETVVGGTVNPDEWRLGWQLVDGRQKSWILFNFDAI
jgi:phosphoenolpyruvate synthase/pyruvate phosphate dikinase